MCIPDPLLFSIPSYCSQFGEHVENNFVIIITHKNSVINCQDVIRVPLCAHCPATFFCTTNPLEFTIKNVIPSRRQSASSQASDSLRHRSSSTMMHRKQQSRRSINCFLFKEMDASIGANAKPADNTLGIETVIRPALGY